MSRTQKTTTEDSAEVSYMEAALMIGCDHHYVRMLTARGILEVARRFEVRRNVLKVMLTRKSVEAFIDAHRARTTVKMRLTEEEQEIVERTLANFREKE